MDVQRINKATLGQVQSKEEVAKDSIQFQSIMGQETK